MRKLFERLKNIGVDSNTDLEAAKRIRLCNSMSVVAVSAVLAISIYANLTSWPLKDIYYLV